MTDTTPERGLVCSQCSNQLGNTLESEDGVMEFTCYKCNYVRILRDHTQTDLLLLAVLTQACGIKDFMIDNRCMSAYEDACDYLKDKGLLEEINPRSYKIVEDVLEDV